MTDPSWKCHRSPTPKTKLPTAKVSQEYNWQASQNSVRERNAVMYNNPLMADVCFTVGTAPNVQKIPAHKYVLAVGSSVFHAMFYGGLADHQDAVELPDVEPAAFQNLLRYTLHSFFVIPLLMKLGCTVLRLSIIMSPATEWEGALYLLNQWVDFDQTGTNTLLERENEVFRFW